jgi:hypothetical protein
MDRKFSRREIVFTSFAMLVIGCRPSREEPEPKVTSKPLAPLPQTSDGGNWYWTVEGDTLRSVAERSGLSMVGIVEANHLTSIELEPGMRLWLPGATRMSPSPNAPIAPKPEVNAPVSSGSYTLVPRSAWTNDRIKGNNNPMGKVLRITLHHTGEHAGLVGLPDVEVIRRIEKYHRNERGWAAIGYHYLVGKDGRVYEGRPVKYQGAHVSSENENNLGISVMGDFNRSLPNAKQLAAVEAFLTDQRLRFNVAKRSIFGHRDLNKSVCPGDALYAWLRNYKRA